MVSTDGVAYVVGVRLEEFLGDDEARGKGRNILEAGIGLLEFDRHLIGPVALTEATEE